MVRFSKANVKIAALSEVAAIAKYLVKRKVYSFDLISGHTCPFAKDCLSKVVTIGDKRRIQDGPDTQFRCFSASQEVLFPALYNLRMANFTALRGKSTDDMVATIQGAMPANLGVCRIHVGGDFFSPNYFLAWATIAKNNPDKLFYAYTKSLSYWVNNMEVVNSIPNFVLSASYGGRCDVLIAKHNLRYSRVVFSESEAKKLKLEIDHDDSHAANPTRKNKSFALLLHGQQPAESEASKAIKAMKDNGVKYSYARKKSLTTV